MSNAEKTLVPHRRFKEFENAGAWEQHKLGDISEIYDGVHQTPDYKKSGVMFLSVENISNLKSNKFISQEDFENNFKVSPKHGDILMTRIGNVGTPNVVESTDPLAFYVSLALIKPKLINQYFLCNSIESPITQANIQKRTLTTAIPQKINKDEIKNVEIKLPRYQEEQAKIGIFLQKIDHVIALHQRKLDKLKRLKSAYLTEMFPAEGERKPKRRFAGFTDDWEQHKLGELGNITTGNTPKTSENNYWSTSGFIWITPSDIKSSTISDSIKHLSNLGWEKARKVPAYSLLVTCIASIGKNIINVVPAAFNQQINALVPVDNDVYFLLSLINQESSRLSSIAGQTATAIINKKTFEKFDVVVPKLQEQKKMGKLFSKLDNLIALHQRKLNKLKRLKSAYLNEMFV